MTPADAFTWLFEWVGQGVILAGRFVLFTSWGWLVLLGIPLVFIFCEERYKAKRAVEYREERKKAGLPF